MPLSENLYLLLCYKGLHLPDGLDLTGGHFNSSLAIQIQPQMITYLDSTVNSATSSIEMFLAGELNDLLEILI